MSEQRRRSVHRVVSHLRGWRLWVIGLSAVPLLIALLLLLDEPWFAALVTLVGILPAIAVFAVLTVDTARSSEHLTRIIGPGRRITTDLDSIEKRLDLIDSVVSSETRRPWEPTTLPFHFVSGPDPLPVLLLPGADYHLPEIVAVAEELDSRGLRSVIAVGSPHWERTGDGLIWYDRPVYEAPEPRHIDGNFSAVVTMKDWAGYAPLVIAAKEAGIPTFAKVEGAQDFHDVDTNQPRRPYRTADHILCQGQHDYVALDGMKRTIVGSTRLERLWWAPPAIPAKPMALINLNFTYGVLTEARDLWLKTAIEGCERAGFPYVISVHPAERARHPHPKVTSISASRLLRHATVLISRFSTLPFEATARGVPFIYHNPHREEVELFRDASDAFEHTETVGELARAVADQPTPGRSQRERTVNWFEKHISLDPETTSEARSTTTIISQVRNT